MNGLLKVIPLDGGLLEKTLLVPNIVIFPTSKAQISLPSITDGMDMVGRNPEPDKADSNGAKRALGSLIYTSRWMVVLGLC